MSLSVVNVSINSLVYQTKLDIISAFKEFLLQETEIENETLVVLLDKFKTDKIGVADVASKKGPKAPKAEKAAKRAPTAYNIFLSSQMKGLKASMAEGQAAWKKLKEDNPDLAKDSKALLLKYQNAVADGAAMDVEDEAEAEAEDEAEDEEKDEAEDEEKDEEVLPPTKKKSSKK